MASLSSLLEHRPFDIYSGMEIFATALLGDLRLVIARLAMTDETIFYLSFFNAAEENRPMLKALKLDAAIACAISATGVAPSTDVQHCEAIAHVLEHGRIREGLASELRSGEISPLISAMLGSIDAAREQALIGAALPSAVESSRKLSL